MLITNVHLGGDPRGNFLGSLSFVIDGALKVCGLRVIVIDGAVTICMPTREIRRPCVQCFRGVPRVHDFCGFCGARQATEGCTFRDGQTDVVFPISVEARANLCGVLMRAVDEQMEMREGKGEGKSTLRIVRHSQAFPA